MSDLDRLAETLAAMTPGPWRTGTSDDHWRREVRSGDGSVAFCSHVQQEAHADAAGIATLRNIAPELIAVARWACSIECETSGEYYKCCDQVSGEPHMSDCPVPALDAALSRVLEREE